MARPKIKEEEENTHQYADAETNAKKQTTSRFAEEASTAHLQSLRRTIESKLHEREMYQRIQQLILEQSQYKAKTQADVSTNESVGQQALAQQVTEGNLKQELAENQDDSSTIVQSILHSDLMKSLMTAIKQELQNPEDQTFVHQNQTEENIEDDVEVQDQPSCIHNSVLHVRVVAGKAFVDQLTTDPMEHSNHEHHYDNVEGDENAKRVVQLGDVEHFFRLIAFFQQTRLVSKDVVCSVDPLFQEDWAFPIEVCRSRIDYTRNGIPCEVQVLSPWEALCAIDEPLRLVLVKVTKRVVAQAKSMPVWREVRRQWIASHCVEWRRVLCSSQQPMIHLPVQLIGRMKAPIGTMDLRMELMNFHRSVDVCKQVSSYLKKENLQVNALNHAFYEYAKQWWEEYRSETRQDPCSSHVLSRSAQEQLEHLFASSKQAVAATRRFVKLFAEDETGKFRFVCKFLTPLQNPKAIRGPCEAARFVALIPYDATILAGGVKDETWRSMATFLAIGKGDCQDHAILLASLLLGCGLDAYVCIGTISPSSFAAATSPRSRRTSPNSSPRVSYSRDRDVGHIWVLTRGINTTDVTFWEPLTGERYSLKQRGPARYGYRSIDCVFNDDSFFANCQARQQRLSECSFAFEDATLWKSMNKNMIARLPTGEGGPPRGLELVPPDLSGQSAKENVWLRELKQVITSERKNAGLVTKWSRQLGFLLLPALNSYEMERLYGVAQLENEFFQQSIKRFVPEGSTFQGFPSMFTSETPSEALQLLLKHEIANQICQIHAAQAQHGLAVRCFAYPEGIWVVWIMFAVVYPSVDQV